MSWNFFSAIGISPLNKSMQGLDTGKRKTGRRHGKSCQILPG